MGFGGVLGAVGNWVGALFQRFRRQNIMLLGVFGTFRSYRFVP